jgi:hypothetical protein
MRLRMSAGGADLDHDLRRHLAQVARGVGGGGGEDVAARGDARDLDDVGPVGAAGALGDEL